MRPRLVVPAGPSSTSVILASADLGSGVEARLLIEGGFLGGLSVAKKSTGGEEMCLLNRP